eukprot:c10878_g1_i1.p1 GENE.c10878_g1_i1~~c10878_g1_i1.p1  ORF type:complete len:367 (+),score=71.15 c10878_g1_i1:871-1971(+)
MSSKFDVMAISALVSAEEGTDVCRLVPKFQHLEPALPNISSFFEPIQKEPEANLSRHCKPIALQASSSSPPHLPAPSSCDTGRRNALFDFLVQSHCPINPPQQQKQPQSSSFLIFQNSCSKPICLPAALPSRNFPASFPTRSFCIGVPLASASFQSLAPKPPIASLPVEPPQSRDEAPRKRLRTFHIPDNHVNSIQCVAWNRKTRTRCGNPALMNYVGSQPQHCSEHIHLDPESIYQKCSVVTIDRDTKRHKYCKEVVLKEVQACFKHMPQHIASAQGLRIENGDEALKTTRALIAKLRGLLDDLQKEVNAVKQMDPGEYQRKIKLVPKYQSTISTLSKHEARLMAITQHKSSTQQTSSTVASKST